MLSVGPSSSIAYNISFCIVIVINLYMLLGRQFYCPSDRRCIEATLMCNGVPHCSGCEDEVLENCLNTPCIESLGEKWICSTMNQNCLLGYCAFIFLGNTRCGISSGQCIETSRICDGVNDCINKWDEQECNETGEFYICSCNTLQLYYVMLACDIK